MKRLTSVILCSALSLTAAFYAGAADIAEDFEGMTANARPVGCEVIEKTGSSVLVLSQGNNKFVRISAVKPDEANLGDAYINYNDNSLENQASYELSLTPRDTVGTKAFMFRDASANFLSLARFSNGVLTLLPDFASGSSWASSYSVGILCRLRFVINVKTRTVTVYKDGTKLKTVENADVKSAVFSRFDFSKFTARVQNQSLENAGEASVMDVDNIRFTKEYGIKQNMSVTSLDFTKNINNKTYSVENTVAGNISGNAVIENNTSAPVKIAAVLAHFNSGVLTGAAYRAETVNAGQREKITALYNSPDSEGEMRLFFWNADTLEPLTGGNAKLEKGKYKTPFVDEILNDFTAYGATSHPRLFGNAADFEAAKLKYPGDENLSRAYANLISKANALLPKPVTVYSLNSLNQLLSVSREALDRAQILGMAYKLSNAPDKIKYAERLADELIAVSRFPDWNPQHFLDTSEMTVAAAIGYDWIYDALDASQKTEIKQAIITKGLTPGKLAYDGQLGSWGNWVSWDWNWNVVCNGGLAVGALAVMDDDPDLAAEIIQNGLKSYRVMVGEFAPDGAWKEGPGYWAYTAKYLTFYMAVLESALGTSYGYFDAEGVAGTCYYAIYMSGGKKS
jgi:hypothetical protein